MKAILEQIKPPVEHSFFSFQYATRRFDCPYHYHPEIELTLIEAGRGQRLIGDHLASFQPGDLVLIGSELPHSYFHAPGFDEGPRGAASIVLQFLPELAGNLLAHAPECAAALRLLHKARRGISFSPTTRDRTSDLLRKIVPATGLDRLILFLEILKILTSDRKTTCLTNEGFHPNLNEHQAQRIERVCSWLTRHFCDHITLDQAAQVAHLTPPAFSRFFHRATNRPFIRFLNELRIGHACRLLLETEKPISEIAFECGFENLSNFNRHFQTIKETTPRQYRTTKATLEHTTWN